MLRVPDNRLFNAENAEKNGGGRGENKEVSASSSVTWPVLRDLRVKRLVYESVLDQRPERGEAVPPGDLLPLGIVAAFVGDGHLVHPRSALEELGRDLGLDAEAVAAQWQRLQHVGPHRLEAGLHVGHGRVVEHVGDEVQEQVREVVREQEAAVAADETAPEDGVRL